jgi:hypothetical protein
MNSGPRSIAKLFLQSRAKSKNNKIWFQMTPAAH